MNYSTVVVESMEKQQGIFPWKTVLGGVGESRFFLVFRGVFTFIVSSFSIVFFSPIPIWLILNTNITNKNSTILYEYINYK